MEANQIANYRRETHEKTNMHGVTTLRFTCARCHQHRPMVGRKGRVCAQCIAAEIGVAA